MPRSSGRRKAVQIIAAVAMYFVLTFLIPSYIMYGPTGAAAQETNLRQYLLYLGFGLSAIVVLLSKAAADLYGYWDKEPELNGFDQFLYLHFPENTWLGSLSKHTRSTINITAFSTILAMMVGFSVSVSGTLSGGFGTPNLVPGSIGDSASLVLAVEPAVSAETLVIQFAVLWISMAWIYNVLRARGVPEGSSRFIAKTIAVVTTTIFAYFYHSFQYAAVESALGGILVLFLILNTVTVLIGSIIPAYLIHAATNFFSTAINKNIITSEEGAVIAGVIGMLAAAVLFWNIIRRTDT